MRIKLLSICLAVLMSVCSLPVFATEGGISFTDVTVSYERSSGTVTVSGTAPFAENADEPVRLMVLKPETDLEDLMEGTVSFIEVGIHVDETALSGDKSFAFSSFVLPQTLPLGDYILRVAAENSAYTTMVPVATVEQAILAMNQVEDAELVAALIEKYNDVYQLDVLEGSDYSKLDAAGKKLVLEGMCNKTYTDAEAIKNNFDAYMQLYRVYSGPWGILEEIIEEYASILELTAYMEDFEALGSKKDLVYKALVGKKYSDVTAFAEAFKKAVVQAENTKESSGSSPSSNRNTGKVTASLWMPTDAENTGNTQSGMTPQAKPFTDLEGFGWAEEGIIKLYNRGIINGKATGIFAPAEFVTRAEAVKMIVLALSTVDGEAVCDFSDVSADSWMYPYMATAVKLGIVFGYGDGTAGALAPVTRQDFAAMLMRALEANGKTVEAKVAGNTFNDHALIADYAIASVETLQKAGVVNGAEDNCFYPANNTKRAEAAKIIAALLSYDNNATY
ncbi:MAG: S-layer homology domain-containing protein [Clostridia bacterium]|nr:S-layer homology domain-containing protein [Clostridia bacterium]